MIPQVRGVLKGWTLNRSIQIIEKVVVDGFVKDLTKTIIARINIQPMPSQKVNRKPEEQRVWKWYEIFCYSSLKLEIDDKIIADKTYKICEINDWSESGVLYYEAVEDFKEIDIGVKHGS